MNTDFIFQARFFLKLLNESSQSELISHADEMLIFLNRFTDTAKNSPKLNAQIQSLREIIYGLESNPEQTLKQIQIREKLTSFFSSISQIA